MHNSSRLGLQDEKLMPSTFQHGSNMPADKSTYSTCLVPLKSNFDSATWFQSTPHTIPVMPSTISEMMVTEKLKNNMLIKTNQEPYSGTLQAQCALHAQYVLQLLQLQRRAGFLCDITVHVRDRSFKAHKPLLAACSLYFRALFADISTKESTALNLTSLTPTGFEILLDYIYSGSLGITAENSSEVLSAATCLQMTNVVETCLNFMRSSFRMSKHTESTASSDNHSFVNGATAKSCMSYIVNDESPRSPQNVVDKPIASHIQKNPVEHPSPQDNFQIVAAGSINLDEFQRMIVHPPKTTPFSHTSQDLINSRRSSQRLSEEINFPSTSQLQSTIPFLTTTDSQQHTPQESQQSLPTFPNILIGSKDKLEHPIFRVYSETTSTSENVQPPSHLLTVPNEHNEMNKAFSVQTSMTSAPSNKSYVTKTSSAPPQTSKVIKNGITSASNINDKDAYSDKGLSTVIPAVACTLTTEQYSGITQAVNFSDHRKDGKEHDTGDSQETCSPTHYSSDDQGNSVEISSDEESECDTWSADRSVLSSTDLSGTPCHATASVAEPEVLSHTSVNENGNTVAPLNLTTKSKTLAQTNEQSIKTTIVKCSSLPLPIYRTHCSKSLSRSHSTDCGKIPIITLEKAASAMEAVSFSTREHKRGASSLLSISESTCGNSTIVSHSISNSPPSSGAKSVTSTFVPPGQWSENKRQSESMSADDADASVKIEQGFLDEADGEPGGFPMAEWASGRESTDRSNIANISRSPSLSPERLDISELTRYSAGENELTNSDDNIGEALDLSVSYRPTEKLPLCSDQDSYSVSHQSSVTAAGTGRIHPNSASLYATDAGTQIAVDALSLLSQSHPPTTSHNETDSSNYNRMVTDNIPQDHLRVNEISGESDGLTSSSQHAVTMTDGYMRSTSFSRKPRRTMGGQTCMWPGCGRLFRHRNIYEEHKKLHEIGIPVSQLRRCYMGARVKKTVREQLEEMRTSDQTGESRLGSGRGKHLRARKRKSSDNPEPVRKRVNVKDRNASFQFFSKSTPAVAPNPSKAHGVSIGTSDHQFVPFLQPSSTVSLHRVINQPAPMSALNNARLLHVVGQDGVIRVVQSNEPSGSFVANFPMVSSNNQQSKRKNVNSLGVVTAPVTQETFATVSQLPVKRMNPVEATLAQLGISTSVRQNFPDSSGFPVTSLPVSTLSSDQMRRRLAIRETSTVCSESLTMLSPRPTIEGFSTTSSVSRSKTITPGNVPGTKGLAVPFLPTNNNISKPAVTTILQRGVGTGLPPPPKNNRGPLEGHGA